MIQTIYIHLDNVTIKNLFANSITLLMYCKTTSPKSSSTRGKMLANFLSTCSTPWRYALFMGVFTSQFQNKPNIRPTNSFTHFVFSTPWKRKRQRIAQLSCKFASHKNGKYPTLVTIVNKFAYTVMSIVRSKSSHTSNTLCQFFL